MLIDPLLVFTVVFVVILVGIILLIGTRMEKRKRKLSVILPAGWYDVPGASPLEYHPEGEGGGVLQISLTPPFKEKITSGQTDEKKLVELNEALSMRKDLGERIALSHEEAEAGIMATATYRGLDGQITQFWMIPRREITIVGTYITGEAANAEQELVQAAGIMRSAKFQ